MADYRSPYDPTAGKPRPGSFGADEVTAVPTTPTHAAAAAAPAAAPAPATVPRGRLARLLRTAVRWILRAAIAYLIIVATLLVAYRWVNPPASTLMIFQWLSGTPVRQSWVPLSRISPNLQRAVIMSEDARFCTHAGVDWREIEEAYERSSDGSIRGASTISMQVAKNLFLWPSKSYLRKSLEIPIALTLEVVWPKPRVLEMYLNIAEWGPGIFGAEAAARHHFRKTADRLTEREAALLAVALPNPLLRDAGRPGPGLQRLAGTIEQRMKQAAPYTKCLPANR